jgi:hypothetical protein
MGAEGCRVKSGRWGRAGNICRKKARESLVTGILPRPTLLVEVRSMTILDRAVARLILGRPRQLLADRAQRVADFANCLQEALFGHTQ